MMADVRPRIVDVELRQLQFFAARQRTPIEQRE